MNRRKRHIIIILLLLFLLGTSYVFLRKSSPKIKPIFSIDFLENQDNQIDSLISHMSIEEKIGMLILYKTDTISKENALLLTNTINRYKISGAIIQADSISTVRNFVKNLKQGDQFCKIIGCQSLAGFPNVIQELPELSEELLVNTETSDSINKLFTSLAKSYIYNMGLNFVCMEGLKHLSNFKPDNLYYTHQYVSKTIDIAQDLGDNGILVCMSGLKSDFFPDSISFSNSLDLYRSLVYKRIPMILEYGNSGIQNQSLKYLKSKLKFQGLIAREFEGGSVHEGIFQTDLYISSKPLVLIDSLKNLYARGKLTIDNLNQKVQKILLTRKWLSEQNHEAKLGAAQLEGKLKFLERQIQQNASVVVKNTGDLLPFLSQNSKFNIIMLGNKPFRYFREMFQNYSNYKIVSIDACARKQYNNQQFHIFVADLSGLGSIELKWIQEKLDQLAVSDSMVFVNFGSYSNLKIAKDFPVIVQVNDAGKIGQETAAQILFGGMECNNRMPFRVSEKINAGAGCNVPKVRVQYAEPIDAGVSMNCIKEIDSIALSGIRNGAFPGCQVFIALDGKIIMNKSYGFHTYDKKRKVKNNHLYDIASLTKIAATTTATMLMISQGKMSLDDKLGEFFKDTEIEYTRIPPDTIIHVDTLLLSEVKNMRRLLRKRDTIHLSDSIIIAYDTMIYKLTPKVNIFKRTVREVLSHLSGLPPAMPILKYIIWNQDTILPYPDSIVYALFPDSVLSRKDSLKLLFDKYFTDHPIKDSSERKIAENMYLKNAYCDTFWIDTKQIRVYNKSVFMYSDVNMNILQIAIDSANGYSIEKYLRENIYDELGLDNIMYNPLRYRDTIEITPTADEKYFRRQLLHGYVHDESAALLGGIAGNAGLFANAHDLGVLMHVFLFNGYYGGKKYINSQLIEEATRIIPESGRGMGFDIAGPEALVAKGAGPSCYGHTGFTGTCIWVDKKYGIVYVFLSNRVYPSVKNWKINTLKIRQNIHQAIYDEIKKESLIKDSL